MGAITSTLNEIRRTPILWLLLLVPVVLVYKTVKPDAHTALFLLSVAAIIPLAATLGRATESVAARTGDMIGGLLNATLGNLTELIIALAALRAGQIILVKASLAGAILTNSLFMLGASFLLGGLKFHTQEFSRANARLQARMMFLASVALVIPSVISSSGATGAAAHGATSLRHELGNHTMEREPVVEPEARQVGETRDVPVFAGNNDAALVLLFNNKVAAAGSNSQLTEGYAKREGKSFRVLWQSGPLHDLALMAASKVPEKDVRAVAKAFNEMHQDPRGRDILASAAKLVAQPGDPAFVPSDGSEYGAYRNFYRDAPASLR